MKRAAADANLHEDGAISPSDMGSHSDLYHLRQQFNILQQELRLSQARESLLQAKLAASESRFEKLRVLTLEGFQSQRTDARSEQMEVTASAPSDGAKQPSAVIQEAVRIASQSSSHSVPAPMRESSCGWIYPSPRPHSQPRVGMIRSFSHDGTTAMLSTSGLIPHLTSPLPDCACLSAPSSSLSSNVTLPLPPPPPPALRQDMLAHVPHGYAKGAICIEPPKRQRNVTSTLNVSRAVPRPETAVTTSVPTS